MEIVQGFGLSRTGTSVLEVAENGTASSRFSSLLRINGKKRELCTNLDLCTALFDLIPACLQKHPPPRQLLPQAKWVTLFLFKLYLKSTLVYCDPEMTEHVSPPQEANVRCGVCK